MIPFVDLKRQYQTIKPEIDRAIQKCIDETAFISGKYVEKLEKDFASLTGAKFGVAASSGTSALHLALMALSVGKDDEVIAPVNTFVATTEAIVHAGAKIKLVDIDEKTYHLDIQKLRKAITKKTKVIIPVHLYGQPCRIDEVLKVAREYHLKVIFDACQAHFSEFKGQPIGKFGDCVCYSFYPGKNLGTYGDGGLVTTNDAVLAKFMKMTSDHGRTGKYEHLIDGYNYRLSEIFAAILSVKLKYLSQWTQSRRENARMYNDLLKDLKVITPFESDDVMHVYHLYVIRVKNRDKVRNALAKDGISTGIHYPLPLHLQKVYKHLGYKKGDFPVAEKCAKEILSLPMFAELTEEEIRQVVATLKKVL
ncbi:MAG TPA: DegT/DnrJ/EryC1/StrS family aminotransferase [Candidatus Omnitrophota bacterium]|nr:DegT/DnrJ/EryC1/StrS family aminotransferase [Candidatus Omnitrophota bacterium]